MSDVIDVVDLQHRLQKAVVSVMRPGRGLPRRRVAALLTEAIAAAGLPDQPGPWVRTAAAEIAVGRLVVLNKAEIPDHLENAELDPETHAAG